MSCGAVLLFQCYRFEVLVTWTLYDILVHCLGSVGKQELLIFYRQNNTGDFFLVFPGCLVRSSTLIVKGCLCHYYSQCH